MADLPVRPLAAVLGRLDFRFTRQQSLLLRTLLLLSSYFGAAATHACEDWVAKVIAAEGTVEVERADRSGWQPVTAGTLLCTGDAMRVNGFSRATVRLRDETVLRYDEHTTLVLGEPRHGLKTWIDLVRGAIHVISRDPRSLKFSTPYLNAGLEGTEFVIRVTDTQAEVAVLEGEVVVENPLGLASVTAGQVGSASSNQRPVAADIDEPLDYMRWGTYYPPVIDGPLPSPTAAVASADPEQLVRRAAARLTVGQADDARGDVAAALRADPGHAAARALNAIIALQHGDRATADADVSAALATDPTSSPALLAASYVGQAARNDAEALSAARAATTIAPGSAVAWARLAELELARDDYRAGVAAAERALSLAPTLGYAHAVTGFARLRELRSEAALDAFTRAIELDPALPLARLGLGLARAQRFGGTAGRRDVELAVLHDPASPLLRSYMGKVYAAENRHELAATLLELADRFDPDNATAPLYEALQKQSQNRPIEALEELTEAVQRNGGLPVFRSEFGLDEDLATRSAGLGRLHRELGFERLAMLSGWISLALDPTDYSAHRLLADVYSTEPLYELARTNELFLSLLWQPINVTPVPAQLGEPATFAIEGLGPSELAFSEFQPRLLRNGLRFEASAVAGAHDTVGEQATISGLRDRFSYSVGQFRFATDGFRPNNDVDQRIANALFQARLTESTSFLAEARKTEAETGDTSMLFNGSVTGLRSAEETDSLRLGMRHALGRGGTLLATAAFQDASSRVTRDGGDFGSADGDGTSIDVQHTRRFGRWSVISGLEWDRKRIDHDLSPSTVRGAAAIPVGAGLTNEDSVRRTAYGYATWRPSDSLLLTFGASTGWVDAPWVDRDGTDGKLGLIWRPWPGTTVRVAALQATQATLTTSRQNVQPRLEPSQVAGFNQFQFGSQGERATLRGIGFDQQISRNLFAGVQWSEREIERPFGSFAQASSPATLSSTDVMEETQRGYLYWTPTQRLSFASEYSLEQVDSDSAGLFGFTDTRIRRLPLEVRYFAPTGWSVGLKASRVLQEGMFVDPVGSERTHGEDAFWIVDAHLGYRLPNRRGIVSLNVANLTDETFRFQEIDPERLTYMPERTAFLRFTLAFQ